MRENKEEKTKADNEKNSKCRQMGEYLMKAVQTAIHDTSLKSGKK